MNNYVIREATPADDPALARLHVTTFNETHAPAHLNGPTYEVREYQWRQIFQTMDASPAIGLNERVAVRVSVVAVAPLR
jgi:hypothetical protein